MLILSSARYRCTTCGDCCRGWDVPLQEGESAHFLQLASQLVPAERLRGAIGRGKHNGIDIETLAGSRGQCSMLAEDQLCRIHGRFGEPEKPRACRIFPYTFVHTPGGVRVGLSWACPAVVDAEGPPLSEQRAEVEAVFHGAVDGTRYLLQVGAEVALHGKKKLPWAEAERLLSSLSRPGSLLQKLCGAGAVCALLQLALDDGKPFAQALEEALAGAEALTKEALSEPVQVDRLSRAMFRTLLRVTQPGVPSLGARLGQLRHSLWGGGRVKLRGGGEVALTAVGKVARGLGDEGEALLSRWVEGALASLTFFGDAAFGLPIMGGLNLLALACAVAAFLARASAAANGRTRVWLEDVRAAVRQVDAGLSHRSGMPRRFDRALDATAALDLLREQLGAV